MLGLGLVLRLGVGCCWPRGAQQQQGTSRVGGGELKDRPWAAAAPLQLHHDDLDNQGIQRGAQAAPVLLLRARHKGVHLRRRARFSALCSAWRCKQCS